jgi:acyl-CoA reductase-like NAD-dependent aldehyde dehydrogenase
MYEVDHFINGSFVPASCGTRLSRENPATGAPLRAIARGDAADVAKAADAAQRAFESWGCTPASERSRILLAIASGLDARLDELALLESEDTGKPLSTTFFASRSEPSVASRRGISRFTCSLGKSRRHSLLEIA